MNFIKTIEIVSLVLLLIASFSTNVVSGGAHFDVGLGDSRFFLGERFLITFKDAVYWVAGMCMGLIFATTFIFLTDYDGALSELKNKNKVSNRNRGGGTSEESDSGTDRDARLIGFPKYPTHLEQRILEAIHTEPADNYLRRQARQIGDKLHPTEIESEAPDNASAAEELRNPLLRLLDILFPKYEDSSMPFR